MTPLILHLTEELAAIIHAIYHHTPGRAHWLARKAIEHIAAQPDKSDPSDPSDSSLPDLHDKLSALLEDPARDLYAETIFTLAVDYLAANAARLSDFPACQAPTGEDETTTFTAWCCQASGSGTIHISSFEATDLTAAMEIATLQCMEDWEELNPANIHLLGIASGDIEILYWNDIDGGDM